jgi:hypothetical protein
MKTNDFFNVVRDYIIYTNYMWKLRFFLKKTALVILCQHYFLEPFHHIY